MKLTLVSRDAEVRDAIQEILGQHANIRLRMVSDALQCREASDVYIWDFEPGGPLAAIKGAAEARKHLFLVKRHELDSFRESAPPPGVGILLKPVARPILEAFLEHAAERRPARDQRQPARDQILQSLIQANLKLQEYEQDRANFLARAVHDFRAPLTAVSGYCGLLLGGQLGPVAAEQREVLIRMEQSARRLTRMASAMFQFSANRLGNQSPSLLAGDIRQSVDQALEEVAPLTGEKNIEVALDWIAPLGPLYFDRAQIEQAVANLLENACKFVPKFGWVEIKGYPCSWERQPGSVNPPPEPGGAEYMNAFRIDIRDSGPSIPERYLDKIFEEYTMYTGGQDRSCGGLALAISKSIIARHQGRIWAENSPHGTLFSFVLPVGAESRDNQAGRAGAATAGFSMEA